MYTAWRAAQLILGVAHRHKDMQFALVLELLGLLLGRMVEETCFHQRPLGYCPLGMQPLESRSGIRVPGLVCLPRHCNLGESAVIRGTRDIYLLNLYVSTREPSLCPSTGRRTRPAATLEPLARKCRSDSIILATFLCLHSD
jgi:hypothetical protein